MGFRCNESRKLGKPFLSIRRKKMWKIRSMVYKWWSDGNWVSYKWKVVTRWHQAADYHSCQHSRLNCQKWEMLARIGRACERSLGWFDRGRWWRRSGLGGSRRNEGVVWGWSRANEGVQVLRVQKGILSRDTLRRRRLSPPTYTTQKPNITRLSTLFALLPSLYSPGIREDPLRGVNEAVCMSTSDGGERVLFETSIETNGWQ